MSNLFDFQSSERGLHRSKPRQTRCRSCRYTKTTTNQMMTLRLCKSSGHMVVIELTYRTGLPHVHQHNAVRRPLQVPAALQPSTNQRHLSMLNLHLHHNPHFLEQALPKHNQNYLKRNFKKSKHHDARNSPLTFFLNLIAPFSRVNCL